MNDILEIDGIKLDPENKQFFQAAELVIESNQNPIFVTGKAGTGKTTFIKYIRQVYPGNTVVLAPTGVAAVNAGGQTINSFFKLEFTPYIPGDKKLSKPFIYEILKYKEEKRSLIENLSLLIIDEISMVRCDTLDAIDTILKCYRHSSEPFGGVKVLLVGDLFQLPPIATNQDWRVLGMYYKSPYFFDSNVCQSYFPYIELDRIYSVKEIEFIDLLNKIRINQLSDADLENLNKRYGYKAPKESIILAPHKNIVKQKNDLEYNKLGTPEFIFNAITTGIFPDSMKLVDDCLKLKVGEQVMIKKNRFNVNTQQFEFFNGSIGVITEIDNGCRWVRVRLKDKEVTVYPEKWENIEFIWDPKTKESTTNILGSYTQIPLVYAWAITINASQGLRFDNVIADLNSCFAPGQVYVALSRCRKLSGLYLEAPILRNAIKIDQRVLNFSLNKTPDTMIIEQIESGKADRIYKDCRQAFDDNDSEKMIADYKEAVKIRDDFDTPKFNKYIKVKLDLFHHYKARCRAFLETLSIKDAQLQDKDKNLSEAEETINNVKDNLALVTQRCDELQKDRDAQDTAMQSMQSAYENLKLELAYSRKETDNQKEKLQITESFLREQLDIAKEELASSKDRLSSANEEIAVLNKNKTELEFFRRELEKQLYATKDELNTAYKEIARLRNLKWYQKLFGKE